MGPFSARSRTFKIDVEGTSSVSKLIESTPSIRLANIGVNPCYISIGVGVQIATVPTSTPAVTCDPVPAGGDITLSVQQSGEILQISSICDPGQTTTLIISTGSGI